MFNILAANLYYKLHNSCYNSLYYKRSHPVIHIQKLAKLKGKKLFFFYDVTGLYFRVTH